MAEGYTATGKVDVSWWIDAVAKGKQFRKDYAQEPRWDDWRRWGRGQWNRGILPSNVYFKMIRTLVPRTYFRNPSVSVTQTKPGMDEMLLAKLMERADNKLLDLMDFKGQMKRSVLQTTMFGTSFMRRGYGAEFTPTPEELGTEGPDVGGRKLPIHVEYNDLVAGNRPWSLNAHPGSIIVPRNCVSIHDARWVCFETTRTKTDLAADPRFKNTKMLQDGIKGTGGSLIASGGKARQEGTLLWEIRDKKTRAVFVIAPYVNFTERDKVEPLFFDEDKLQRHGRLPCYPLIFNQDDEVFWGISDSIIIEPQQLEKNQIRTQMMYHRRVMLAKFLYEKGAISPDELSKMLSDSNVGIAVELKNIAGVKELDMGGVINIVNGLGGLENIIDREVQEQLGLGVNQFGEYAPGSADRSATEANIVNQATAIRIDERRDTCADLMTDFVADMNQDIYEYWTEDMVIDLVGPAGVPIWVKFHPQLLQHGQYDVKVDPDSSIPLTKQYREQKATQVYNLLYGKNQSVNPDQLTHFLLNELYGVDADSILSAPVMQTSQQQPMEFGQAVAGMQQLQSAAPGNNVLPMQRKV